MPYDTNASAMSAKQKRLTRQEWETVKRYWEHGSHTLEQLSDIFGIRADSIQRRLKSENIQKGSLAAEAIRTSIDAEMAQQATSNLKRIHQTKNDHYKFAEALAKLTMNEIIQAKQQSRAFATMDANITALNKAAKTLEVLRKERYALLGLDKEDGDPGDMDELLITELSAEQIKSLQAEMRGDAHSPSSDLDNVLPDLSDDDDVFE